MRASDQAGGGPEFDLGAALRELTATSALEPALDFLLAAAIRRLGGSGGLIGTLEADVAVVRVRAAVGMPESLRRLEIAADQPLIHRILHEDGPIPLADVNALGRGCRGWQAVPPRTAVAWQIACVGGPVGILLVAGTQTGAVQPGPADTVAPIVGLAALAIQRHQLQQRVEAALESAEVANRAKTAFLANMSHELRTPLTSILGYAELLGEPDFGHLNETQAGFARIIGESGQSLLQLINNLLDLANVEAGRARLDLKPLSLPKLLETCLEMVKSRAAKHAIKLDLDVQNVDTIVADEQKLKQVVYHLLWNACKFTPDRGRVGVSAVADDRNVTVTVQDTGIGVPPEELEAIFREFYRVEPSNTAENSGAGLGLALCRRFVQLHHGRIWVDSRPGQGSRFSFTIPLELDGGVSLGSEPAAEQETETHELPVRGAKVLVIEDNPANVGLIRQMLNLAGCQTAAATRGIDGIEQAKRLGPDLILLDIELPDIDGLTVLRVLKADPATAGVPVVAVTAYAMKGDRERMLGAGCDGYISKPIDMKVLRQTLGQLLPHESAVERDDRQRSS